MYPEKLTFDGELLRTTHLNEAMRVFNSVKTVLGAKKDKSAKNADLSRMVAPTGLNSNRLVEDLRVFAAI